MIRGRPAGGEGGEGGGPEGGEIPGETLLDLTPLPGHSPAFDSR